MQVKILQPPQVVNMRPLVRSSRRGFPKACIHSGLIQGLPLAEVDHEVSIVRELVEMLVPGWPQLIWNSPVLRKTRGPTISHERS